MAGDPGRQRRGRARRVCQRCGNGRVLQAAWPVRVRYTPRSRRDLEAIYNYIHEQSPGAARSVKRAIQHA
ncbi:type II toxin-antitoxin system RelE/ParE family toxin, partial [Bradyrhizobium sp.]|uniref:type II toxin-antitoxin system RelE/ParE family toxin n=1 Tax=Bradyrhizobium sp. TaxID=376 RepID=UPI0035235661